VTGNRKAHSLAPLQARPVHLRIYRSILSCGISMSCPSKAWKPGCAAGYALSEGEEAVARVHEASSYWYRDFVQAQRSEVEVAWRASA
jgi:hypothetical protein